MDVNETSSDEFSRLLPLVTSVISKRSEQLSDLPTLASPSGILAALNSLPAQLPEHGWGTEKTIRFILDEVAQGLSPGQCGPRYFGFVTGGVTPAAQLADILATSFDQNVQVHLPNETISTIIESHALLHLLSLLSLDPDVFQGRTLTSGATAANVLGLATARDSFFLKGAADGVPEGWCIAEDGFPPSSFSGRIEVLGVKVHASIVKAAAIVGIGRRNCIDIGDGDLGFDLVKLEERMKTNKTLGKGSIVVVGFGEVNTGGFTPQVPALRALCDKYSGWLHIDGAFGAFAVLLPELRFCSEDLKVADSITADGHKWLNVPYDLGIFYCRSPLSLPQSFGPSPASAPPAYLTPSTTTSSSSLPSQHPYQNPVLPIPSPLNVNIENSRRFRALPLYASLLSLGRDGYSKLVANNIAFGQRVSTYLQQHPKFEVVNPEAKLNVVLFRGSKKLKRECSWHPEEPGAGVELQRALNEARVIYVSPTAWEGRGAVRLAVSNWMTGIGGEKEWEKVRGEFDRVAEGW